MKSLAYLFDSEAELKLLSSEGHSGARGKLKVRYEPTDQSGEKPPNEDDAPDEPEDMLGKPIDFKVIIENASELPGDLCKNVFCEYGLYFEKDKRYRTKEFEGKSMGPVFAHSEQHSIEVVTEGILSYLVNDSICFKVYGYPDFV